MPRVTDHGSVKLMGDSMKAFLLAASAAVCFASAANATNTTVVISGNQAITTPFGPTLAYDGAITGEDTGGGYTAVTTAAPRDGTGSLEIHGDRSRFVIGNIYGNATNGLFNLDTLSSFTFDHRTDATTSAQPHAEPVARLQVFDNTRGVRAEITWEGVYNGGTAGVVPTLDQWLTAGPSSLFYINVRSNGAAFTGANAGTSLADGATGVVYVNGNQYNSAVSTLESFFSDQTYVTGVSFGAGSGFGAGFTGYVDDAHLNLTNGDSVSFNFEPAAAAAVPEPASWAMMIGGFGLVGGALRRRTASGVRPA